MSRNPFLDAADRYSGDHCAADAEQWWHCARLDPASVGTDGSGMLSLRWAARHACRRLREQRDSARQAARLYREDMHAAQDRVARLEAQLARVRRVCHGYPSALADIIRRELDDGYHGPSEDP